MARNSLSDIQTPKKAYIPLKHAVIVGIILIVLPPAIDWFHTWRAQQAQKEEQVLEEKVTNATKEIIRTEVARQVQVATEQFKTSDETVAELKGQIDNLTQKLQELEQTPNGSEVGMEIESIKKTMQNYEGQLLEIADRLEALSGYNSSPNGLPVQPALPANPNPGLEGVGNVLIEPVGTYQQ